MIKVKEVISFFVSFIVIVVMVLNYELIWEKISDLLRATPRIVIKPGNDYVKDDKYLFLKQVDEYVPYNKKDLINIIYSVLNQGWNEFTFYCPVEYDDCIKDIDEISHDKVLLSNINNYVHPYNSYYTIKTLYDDSGRIIIEVDRQYKDYEIKKIDKDIDEILDELIDDSMDDVEKIKVLHDYIIKNTKYDKVREEFNDSEYDSARINGVLYDNYAICSGYTDIMAVMLFKLNIPNYKISSDEHIWNAVLIDGEWLHLDLTWDDPVTTSGKDILDHSFFLIDTDELENLDKLKSQHIFDTDIYLEFR